MRPARISRRFILQAGALALPLLEAMRPAGALAQTAAPPKRFINFYHPGGTVLENWRPRGTPAAYTFGPILEPLTPHKANVTVLDGLALRVTEASTGHPHTRGMGALLTGQKLPPGPYQTNGGNAGFAEGPSVDQEIAKLLFDPAVNRRRSYEMAIRWPTNLWNGPSSAPDNQLIYEAANKPAPMIVNPQVVWDQIFQGYTGSSVKESQDAILGTVMAQYDRWSKRLGAEDRIKMDAHLTRLQELKASLNTTVRACTAPNRPGALDVSRSDNIPAVGKLMIDLSVMALSCDLTRVVTLQFTDSESKNTLPWLGLNNNHHFYQHDGGYQPEQLTVIYHWYAQQYAYLLSQLQERTENGVSLLDSSAVLWVTELQHPPGHGQDNMPFVLAGKAGGALKTGQWLRFNNIAHNNLLLTLLKAYGSTASTFGLASYTTGTLAGLT